MSSESHEISLFDILEDLTEEDPFCLYNLVPNPDETLHTPSGSPRKRTLDIQVLDAPDPEPVSVLSLSTPYQEFFDSLDFLEDHSLTPATNMGINFSSLLWKSGTDPMIGNFDNEHLNEDSVSLVLGQEDMAVPLDIQAQDRAEELPSTTLDAYIKIHLEGYEAPMGGNFSMLEAEPRLCGPDSPDPNIRGSDVNMQQSTSGFDASRSVGADLVVVDISSNKLVRLVSPRSQETTPEKGFMLRSSHLGNPDTAKTFLGPELGLGKKRKLDVDRTSIPKSPFVRLVRLTNAEIQSAGKKSSGVYDTPLTHSRSSSNKRQRRSSLDGAEEGSGDKDDELHGGQLTGGSGARSRGRGSPRRKSMSFDVKKDLVSVYIDGETKNRRGKKCDASFDKNYAKSESEAERETVTTERKSVDNRYSLRQIVKKQKL